MKPPRLDSASGLRPASAFVMIALVLACAGIWAARIALRPDGERGPWVRSESDPEPEYEIADREGRPLALFVQRLDLVMSPNAMWQSHTPAHMADVIARVLDVGERELLEALLPDAVNGEIEAGFLLDAGQKDRVDHWARNGRFDGGEPRPIDGLWVEWSGRDGAFRIHWAPEVALSESARARHECRTSPLRWTRILADGLARCLWGERALGPGARHEDLEAQRQRVWDGLMPSTHAVTVEDFAARRAPELMRLLDAEAVAHHQMHVSRGRSRRYPAGRLPLLGAWGFIERPEAERRALRALGFSADELAGADGLERALTGLGPREIEGFEADVRGLLARQHPLHGLERACDELLSHPAWEGLLQLRPATYEFQRYRAVRQRARSYYLSSFPSSETPRVGTTLDVLLQQEVGRILDGVMELQRPSLAMAIVLEVESGDVLAIASREAYGYSGFAPLYHEFTPGSTFKVQVMAAALEAGVVRPDETFDVGQTREYRIPGRTIHEAESSRTGVLSAAECLAYSVNAGMVQIGTRVPAETLRGTLRALGYGERPGTGLGGERPGYVPPLPWKKSWAHASVCFGHEVSVTLWQHAAALATVVRGGEYRPLRLIRSVDQGGEFWDLEGTAPRRVLSPETCREVREMMQLGAREGTGARVAGPEVLSEALVGTKTGTPQKVAGEVCGHVELAHQEEHRCVRTSCSRACRRALRSAAKPHRNCYTPSMCIWGRRWEDERELLVLVVVDEPRKDKFGGDVAGPAAVAILREALGLTVMGRAPLEDLVEGFAPAEVEPVESSDQPWVEAGW